MINGVIGKGLTVANINLSFFLTKSDPYVPTVTNIYVCNTNNVAGTYSLSIMDNSENMPTSQDSIYITAPIAAYESIDLGNYVLSSNEIIVLNSSLSNISVRVTGIQQLN